MRFDGPFQAGATALAVAFGVLAAGCGTAPDTNTARVAPASAAEADPIDAVGIGDQYDPPPLLDAIGSGELDRVRDLLAAGADVNQHDRVYGTPLVAALQSGQEKIVAALLEAGAKRDGTSAYFLAARELPQRGREAAVRAVADQFAQRSQLVLREHDQLTALLLFDVDDARGQSLVDQHQAELIEQGWFLFRFAHDARRRQDIVGLLPTAEKYVALAYLRTDGVNYDITTERIIDWLRRLEANQSFAITEVGLDFVGGRFLQRIGRPRELAERMFAFCPDIVDQGIGSVEELAIELAKPEPPLYLWWD